MPCQYQPQQDRGKADKMRSAFKIIFEGEKRYRHGELVHSLEQMGHSKRTATRWIKAGVDEGIINNTSAIYSWIQV
jgi:hypothetical protein